LEKRSMSFMSFRILRPDRKSIGSLSIILRVEMRSLMRKTRKIMPERLAVTKHRQMK
jgi:hypothetical protein